STISSSIHARGAWRCGLDPAPKATSPTSGLPPGKTPSSADAAMPVPSSTIPRQDLDGDHATLRDRARRVRQCLARYVAVDQLHRLMWRPLAALHHRAGLGPERAGGIEAAVQTQDIEARILETAARLLRCRQKAGARGGRPRCRIVDVGGRALDDLRK